MIVVIMYHFIIPTKQMKLFQSSWHLHSSLWEENKDSGLQPAQTLSLIPVFSDWRNLIVIPLISAVDKGLGKVN